MFDMHLTVYQSDNPVHLKTCNQDNRRQILTFDGHLEHLAARRRDAARVLHYGNGWCCLYHENAVKQSREQSLTTWYLAGRSAAEWSSDGTIIKTRQFLLDRAWYDAVQAPPPTCIVRIADVLKKIDDYWQQAAEKF